MHKIIYTILILSALLFINDKVNSQKTGLIPVLRINTPAAHFTTDIFGNIYIVTGNNLLKYNKDGALLSTWSSGNKGIITSVDASDPLKILVHCADFGIIQFLDNNLAPASGQILLSDLGFNTPLNVCSSSEGGFWVYNQLSFQLSRFNTLLAPVVQSPDLSANNIYPANPVFIQESNNNIFLGDSLSGIFIVDRFGTFLKLIPINKMLKHFQCYDDNIVFINYDTLVMMNFKTLSETNTKLPENNYLEARISSSLLYLLDSKGVSVYRQKH